MDSIIRLGYEGLEVGYYKVVAENRELLGAIVLTSPACLLLPGFAVGVSASNLTRLFGPPAFRQELAGDSLLLQFEVTTEAVPDYINVILVRDTIRVIQWQYGID